MSGIKILDKVFMYLPQELENSLKLLSHMNRCRLKEIRLYADAPVLLFLGSETVVLQKNGQTGSQPDDQSVYLKQRELETIFKALCEYSVHSFQEEIVKGFITIEGGHRVGLFGTIVMEQGQIHTIKDLSSLNIRIARQIIGAADKFYRNVLQNKLQSILIVGAPGTGKTTLLRDLIRGISSGKLDSYIKVAVIDERGELSAMYHGVSQNDLGFCTDVYNLCPKAKGMEMALRAGSPQLLVCDEIGSEDDVAMLEESMLAGVKVMATAHAGSFAELQKRSHIARLIESGVFDQVVLLENRGEPCIIEQVIDCHEIGGLL